MKPSSQLQIGDIEPYRLETPEQHARWVYVQQQRGRIVRAADRPGTNSFINQAKKIMRGMTEDAARAADPFEQARQFLQRLGWVIFCAEVHDGPADRFVVRGKSTHYSKAQVMNLARSKGWQG